MAKSIRSKWKRKCRAVKRERYGKKELDRLKKTLGVDDSQGGSQDIKMTDLDAIANVTDAKTIKQSKVEEDGMDTDTSKRVFNRKTLMDQHGTYPIWVHPRKMLKRANKKKRNGKKGKKGKN